MGATDSIEFNPEMSHFPAYSKDDYFQNDQSHINIFEQETPEFKLPDEEGTFNGQCFPVCETPENPNQATHVQEMDDSQQINSNSHKQASNRFDDLLTDRPEDATKDEEVERGERQATETQPSPVKPSILDLLQEIFRLVSNQSAAPEPVWWATLDSQSKEQLSLCIAKDVSSISSELQWCDFRDQFCKVDRKEARKDQLIRHLYISFTSKLLADHAPGYKRDKNHEKLPYLQKVLREHYKMPPAMVQVFQQYENVSKKKLKIQLKSECPAMYDDLILYFTNEYEMHRRREFEDWVTEVSHPGCVFGVENERKNRKVSFNSGRNSQSTLLNKKKANYLQIDTAVRELKKILTLSN